MRSRARESLTQSAHTHLPLPPLCLPATPLVPAGTPAPPRSSRHPAGLAPASSAPSSPVPTADSGLRDPRSPAERPQSPGESRCPVEPQAATSDTSIRGVRLSAAGCSANPNDSTVLHGGRSSPHAADQVFGAQSVRLHDRGPHS